MRSPYAFKRQVENPYLVRERDRRKLRELIGVLGIVLVLGGGLLAYTWIHLEILRIGYRADSLEKQLDRLQEEERQRRLEAASLTHPPRIEERAEQQLGMRPPTLEQTFFYEDLAP